MGSHSWCLTYCYSRHGFWVSHARDIKLYDPPYVEVAPEDLLVFSFMILVTIVEGLRLVVVGTDSEPGLGIYRLNLFWLGGSRIGVTIPGVSESVIAGCK